MTNPSHVCFVLVPLFLPIPCRFTRLTTPLTDYRTVLSNSSPGTEARPTTPFRLHPRLLVSIPPLPPLLPLSPHSPTPRSTDVHPSNRSLHPSSNRTSFLRPAGFASVATNASRRTSPVWDLHPAHSRGVKFRTSFVRERISTRGLVEVGDGKSCLR